MGKYFRAAAFTIAIAVCAALASCEDPSSWVLKGEIKFLDLKEIIDAQNAKICTLEYSILNSGKSTISGSVFAFTFSTDKSKYRYTVVDENSISRGALIYGHVSIAYETPDEVGKVADAVVDSAQFR